jgi:stage III sporulation protein SpoIIIAA
MTSGAPWYVSNQTLHEDLKIPQIRDIIKFNINKYKDRTTVHENPLIKDLFTHTLDETRLKRIWPEDLLDDV